MVALSTTSVQAETTQILRLNSKDLFHLSCDISQHWLDGLAQNLVQISMVPRQCVPVILLRTFHLAPPWAWHLFVFYSNISTVIGWIAVKCGTHIHGQAQVWPHRAVSCSSTVMFRTALNIIETQTFIPKPASYTVSLSYLSRSSELNWFKRCVRVCVAVAVNPHLSSLKYMCVFCFCGLTWQWTRCILCKPKDLLPALKCLDHSDSFRQSTADQTAFECFIRIKRKQQYYVRIIWTLLSETLIETDLL